MWINCSLIYEKQYETSVFFFRRQLSHFCSCYSRVDWKFSFDWIVIFPGRQRRRSALWALGAVTITPKTFLASNGGGGRPGVDKRINVHNGRDCGTWEPLYYPVRRPGKALSRLRCLVRGRWSSRGPGGRSLCRRVISECEKSDADSAQIILGSDESSNYVNKMFGV